jgi:predicted MFS family arabinose efflux permease
MTEARAETDAGAEARPETETTDAESKIAVVPLAILFTTVLLVYACTYLLLSILPVYVRSLGHSEATVGWVLGVFSLSALLVRPFAGVFADRAGRRPSIIVGGILMGASCVGYAVAGRWSIFLARVVNGMGWGATTAVTATVAADLAPRNRRGTILGIYGMITGLALATGPSIGIAVSSWLGYTTTFLVGAACGFGAALTIYFLRAPRPPRSPDHGRLRLENLFSRTALGPAAIMLCFSLIYGAVLSFIPLFTIDRGLGTSGRFFTVFAVTLIILRISGGSLSDRFGRFAVVAPGFVLCAIAMLMLASAESRLMLLLAAVFFAAAFAFIQPATQAWAVDRSAAHSRGTVLSTVIAAQDLGISSGSFMAGLLADHFGYGALFVTAAGVSLVGLLPVWHGWRTTRRAVAARPVG